MKRVEQICDLIINKGVDATFFCQARVDSIAQNPRVVKKMKKAGFWMIFLGVETPSQKKLEMIDKGTRRTQIEKAIKILKDNKIVIWGAFILGFPDETEKDMMKVVDYVKRFDIEVAQFTLLTPLIGSKLFDKCKDVISHDWTEFDLATPVMNTRLSKKELARIYKKVYRRYYLRPSYILKRLITMDKLMIRAIFLSWKQFLRIALFGEV
jgi:radical SAM superfamily enzyme YgiQ (UPF0313 family)